MCLAVPGRIESIDVEDGLMRAGRIDFGGVVKVINLAFVPEAGVGDYILAHAGVAIGRISEEQARETLAAFGVEGA
jgi:hydrogenase expression/formation protein HypC